ncbi:hypothetical protein I546_4165 [Mycobacterium kansasii 732]|nr:hypothetical protein I546_4165 [Mycobacterium kansasii 732]
MALTFDDEQAAKLFDSLGLPADTSDVETVLATVADLAAQAAGVSAEKPSTIAAAARKGRPRGRRHADPRRAAP